MARYDDWGTLPDQLEGAIASGRMAGELSRLVPATADLSSAAKRDAALAELLAGTGGLGVFNVRAYGAAGDGVTDDTSAFTQCIAEAVLNGSGAVLIPAGRYRITSTITIPSGLLLQGVGHPGSDSGSQQVFSVLLHDFSGTFLSFTGSTGPGAGVGGGLRSLSLLQVYGSPGVAVGTAVEILATDDDIRPLWQRIENVNIESPSSTGSWTWGIDMNGAADADQLRDFFITQSRIAIRTGGSGAIRMTSVANVFATAFECNLPDANVTITGTGAKKSAGIYLTGCSVAGSLSLDYANLVHVIGGSYNTITNTANTGASGAPCVLLPTWLTNAFTNNAGSNCLLAAFRQSTGMSFYRPLNVEDTSRFTGGIGVGAMGAATQGVLIDPALVVSGSTSGFGVKADGTFGSGVTNTGAAIFARARTEAASFTLATATGISVQDAVKGAGSTITNQYGIKIENQTQGGANYAIHTGTGRHSFGDKLEAPRLQGTGTAHVAGDYALSAGWGSTASVSAVAARDTGGRVSITCNGAGIGADPTVTLTFKDGTWTTIPALSLSRGDAVAPAGGYWALTTPSATAPVFTFVGTPVSGSVYILDFVTMGK